MTENNKSSISDRLKALGVQVGAGKDRLEPPKKKYPIEEVLDGRMISTPYRETYLVERLYAVGHLHGNRALQFDTPLDVLAAWAKEEGIADCVPSEFAFIDTETTGLAGGSGTYAFMIGVGRFEGDRFRLAQFFMRGPREERAQLHALEEFLIGCKTLVSFNGKSFDVPLLRARYRMNKMESPLENLAQLDILHLARRLWRARLPDRSLTYLEEHIIGETRTEEDTPGFMIPQLYFDYLRDGDSRPLQGIFYHNEMDILTMAVLTDQMGYMLDDPLGDEVAHVLDLVAIGKLHEDLKNEAQAIEIYSESLNHDLPEEAKRTTRQRLAWLHRRNEDWKLAMSLWWQAAAERELYAHEELAKYYEHQEKNLEEALKWVEAGLALLNAPGTPRWEALEWQAILVKRKFRLRGKLGE